MCKSKFTISNKPTLDRIDNNKAHTADNVKPCCESCNKAKSNRSEEETMYKIQMRRYAILHKLPMTLTDETTYHILRDGITGGLTNVGHRFNYAGITKINKLSYKDKHVYSTDTENTMTHITGCDWSSLYPSAFSGNTHPFIPYTGHKLYMPGYQLKLYSKETPEGDRALWAHNKQEMLKIINNPDRTECEHEPTIDRLPWFVAVVKGHIPEEYINDYINFPPIIKKLDIETSENVIGKFMYDHIVKNNLPHDKSEHKLTQLLSTHDQFMSFGMYELWFLIDECHFVSDEIDTLITFTKHDKFNDFFFL
jgi:hypothetical protein